MAKHAQPPELIEEIESGAERLAHWIGAHVWLVGGLVLAALALAAGISGFFSWQTNREEAASDALDRTRSAYLEAMGASPGSLELPELASLEIAKQVRGEYVERFREVAAEHPGTVAGTLARLEVAQLQTDLDAGPAAVAAVWDEALASAGSNEALRGIVLQRIAQAHEDAGAWAEAAAVHEQAAAIQGFPLRYWALVDAARCQAQAGDPQRALALYERVEQEAPDLELPPHLRVQLRELRALAASD